MERVTCSVAHEKNVDGLQTAQQRKIHRKLTCCDEHNNIQHEPRQTLPKTKSMHIQPIADDQIVHAHFKNRYTTQKKRQITI